MESWITNRITQEIRTRPKPSQGSIVFYYNFDRRRFHIPDNIKSLMLHLYGIGRSTVERFLMELSELEHACPYFESDSILAIPYIFIGCIGLSCLSVFLMLEFAPPSPDPNLRRPVWVDYTVGAIMGFWILVLSVWVSIILYCEDRRLQRFQSVRQAELTEFFEKFMEKEIDLRHKFEFQISPWGTYITCSKVLPQGNQTQIQSEKERVDVKINSKMNISLVTENAHRQMSHLRNPSILH